MPGSDQRFEMPESDPLLSSRRNCARMAGWVDEKAGCPGHQSRIVEAYGGETANLKSIVWPLHEMEDPSVLHEMAAPSVLLMKPLPSVPLQLRSSPELRDPIKSEPDRESLHQRLRGTPAPHHHRSSANSCRSDWTTVGVTEDATSSSSRRHFKHYGSLHSVPNGGDEIPNSNTYILQGDVSAPYQPSVHPMPHEVSPEDPAPTKNHALTNAAFPSSPKAALVSLPSEKLSPISPMFEDVNSPLTSASSVTLSHHGSSPGTSEHQEGNTGCRTLLSSSPSQLMLKEPNNTLFPFDSLDSDIQSLVPFYDSMESSAPINSQTENSMSQLSLPVVQSRSKSENLDVPSVSTQPHHLRMSPSDLEGLIPSNGSGKVSEVEKSLSMTQSVVTQVYTPRSENPGFSPTAFSSTSPPQNRRTHLDSQCANNIQSPPNPTQLSTAFHIAPLSTSLNRQLGIVTGPVMEMGGFSNSNTSTQNMEQSDAGQLICFPELQPWSPLDHSKATIPYDPHSTGPQWYSNDHCPQAAPQHRSRDSGTGQAPLVKWRPYCFDHNSFLVSRLASKQEQVEDHLQLIRAINYEWMQRMNESQPGLWSLCSSLSASELFDRAMRTFKNFICGSPVEGFEGVFAIMHLAFAAAFSWTWQQDDYLFSALRDDALQWQHALASDEDKTRFLNAMDCWRPHALEPPPPFASADHTNSRSVTPQKSPHCGDQQTLWDRLKKGEVFKACIAFVDSKWIRSKFET